MRSITSTLSPVAAAVIAGVLLWPAGCSKKQDADAEDPIVTVDDDDPDMKAAFAKARRSLPRFWFVFENPQPGVEDFSLKIVVTDGFRKEYLWISEIERAGDKVSGVINNLPSTVRKVKMGERITVPETDVYDWLYMRRGKMVGNYTLRALFKKMTPEEVQKAKDMLAEP